MIKLCALQRSNEEKDENWHREYYFSNKSNYQILWPIFFFTLKSDEHFRWDRALKRSFTESHFLILKCNLFVSIRVLCVCVFGLCILPAKLIKIVGDE